MRMFESLVALFDRCYLIRRYSQAVDYVIFYSSIGFSMLIYLQAIPMVFNRSALLLCPSNGGLMTLCIGFFPFISVVLMNVRYEFDILKIAEGTNSISRFILTAICGTFNFVLFYTVLSEFNRCH